LVKFGGPKAPESFDQKPDDFQELLKYLYLIIDRQAFDQTIQELLARRILPIVNENDAVTVDEGEH
jgi:hypothetical protein